jgi:superfamily II DNA/RNA helicase
MHRARKHRQLEREGEEDINDVVDKMSTQETEEPDESTVQTQVSFNEIGLQTWLVKQCAAMKLKSPTPVQANCIPEILKGIFRFITAFSMQPTM